MAVDLDVNGMFFKSFMRMRLVDLALKINCRLPLTSFYTHPPWTFSFLSILYRHH